MKLDSLSIQSINLFENITGAKVKDCFEDRGELTFVVEEGNIKKAVINLAKVERLMKRKLRILGFSADPVKFINNLIYPLKVENIRKEENKVIIESSDSIIKGKIFGREKENLHRIEGLMKKYFNIDEVIVK